LGKSFAFIGLEENTRTKMWYWQDRSDRKAVYDGATRTSVAYTNWAAGEPNNLIGEEDVVMMNEPSHGFNGGWSDVSRDKRAGVVCEMPTATCDAPTFPIQECALDGREYGAGVYDWETQCFIDIREHTFSPVHIGQPEETRSPVYIRQPLHEPGSIAEACGHKSVCGVGPYVVLRSNLGGRICQSRFATDARAWLHGPVNGVDMALGNERQCSDVGGVQGAQITCGDVTDWWEKYSAQSDMTLQNYERILNRPASDAPEDAETDLEWFRRMYGMGSMERVCSFIGQFKSACCQRQRKCVDIPLAKAEQYGAVRCDA